MKPYMSSLTLIRPDDWHLHLRDGDAMRFVLPDTTRRFGRAIIMPNLEPPVRRVSEAAAYRARIIAELPLGVKFEPLMTLYLTDLTPPEEVFRLYESGFVKAIKYYPAGATTNSDAGVTDLNKVIPTLKAMAELSIPLLVHGEVTDHNVDIFDREAVFIDRVMRPLLDKLPSLKVVFEHITTKQAANFVRSAGDNVAATITAHHLLMNRNSLFNGGIRPHHHCLPVLKREIHREALLEAATSGNSKFFLGTDSAPHSKSSKESSCGCAGIYTANNGIELYAEAFEAVDALSRLEGFASRHGPVFYDLPINTDTITLVKKETIVPAELPYLTDDSLVPLRAGETVAWQIV